MSKEDKFTRPERKGRGSGEKRGREGRGKPGQSLSEEIIELDSELMRLLVHRSVLMGKLRRGKAHAATPGVIKSEKEIRSAWEQQSVRLGGSLRLSRQLFSLIQDLEVQPGREDSSHTPFNLSPSRQPVQLDIAGPSSTIIGQLWLALAAASGSKTRIRPLLRSAPVLTLLRAFEQAGVSMEWQDDSLLLDGAKMPDYYGKAIFVGNDLLTLYIFIFLGLGQPGKLRFTGGPALKDVELGALSRFLPLLGARLVQLVPGTRGLPVNLEASGELPGEIQIPADLPPEAVLAILLAALTWKHKVTIKLGDIPKDSRGILMDLAKRAFMIVPGLGQALKDSIEYNGYAVAELDFPDEIVLPLDPVLCSIFLAMPIFVGGSANIKGKWIQIYQSDELFNMLKVFGLDLKGDDQAVSSSMIPGSTWPGALEMDELSRELHPLFWVLNARLAYKAKGPVRISRYPAGADLDLAEEFLAQAGFKLEALPEVLIISPLDATEFKDAASKSYGWPCPDYRWGLCLSLASFMHSKLKISNPDCVSAIEPDYWHLFNKLPNPILKKASDSAEPSGAGSGRRRIRTSVEARPEPLEGFEGE